MREIHFTPDAWDAYVWWQGQDRKTLKRINTLLQSVQRDPFNGIGKPEPLVGNLSGFWSRRIDETHRLVYEADEAAILVVACRFHYDD
ncbi:MAG: Txe/YoeB family addiction module toxin [Limnohabitans sp.]|jgi:toxin YoeB|uniref:Txe/YoeB family addiction module toxin n=1 Tax=Limnohabitans sp. TaxID=1907725 RepID=UPI0011D9284E|nr:MAG: Txe/YoeB family addiction module toxin [Limnohabitans sp.]